MKKSAIKKEKPVEVKETPVRYSIQHKVVCQRDFEKTDFKKGITYDIHVQKMNYDDRYMVYKASTNSKEKTGYAVINTLEEVWEAFEKIDGSTVAKKIIPAQ